MQDFRIYSHMLEALKATVFFNSYVQFQSLDSLADNDPTGRNTYIKTCENLGVVPVSYFTRHITDPEIVMRYHGLGNQGARAMARVLRVNSRSFRKKFIGVTFFLRTVQKAWVF